MVAGALARLAVQKPKGKASWRAVRKAHWCELEEVYWCNATTLGDRSRGEHQMQSDYPEESENVTPPSSSGNRKEVHLCAATRSLLPPSSSGE